MQHADPWDEIARLEKQMDAELLEELEDAEPAEASRRKAVERASHVRRELDV